MHLHEFLESRRDEIVTLALSKLREHESARADEVVAADLHTYIGEMSRALERGGAVEDEVGLRSATHIGEVQHRHSARAADVAWSLGSISDATGELGAREALAFSAAEYQHFNRCIDAGTAAAIERFEALSELDDVSRLGRLAHELRNALGGAQMALSVLRRGDIGIRGRTGDLLARNLERMHGLIQQTLASVRLEADNALSVRSVAVGPLVAEIVASTPKERGVRVIVRIDGDLEVAGDELLVTSAVTNLIQNAVKFTRDNGTVTVRAYPSDETVVVEVEDECGGLPTSDPEELFAPFVQRSADGRGVGLGLTIAREAVRKQGGSLHVQSFPGKGCSFRVALPRARTA